MASEVMTKKALKEIEKAEKKAELQKELKEKMNDLKFTERIGGSNPSARNLRDVEYRAREAEKVAEELKRLR